MPNELELSRRKALAALGTIGAASAGAGLGTSAFFSDEESFENNRLAAGELDLKVGWRVEYYDWIDGTPRVISESDLKNQSGPIVQLEDLKPGDLINHTLDVQISGNPGFLSMHCEVTDFENGTTEPEDSVNGPEVDDFDGTPGGDLGSALRMAVWFDDGDGLPQEIWAGDFPQAEEEFVMAVGDADRPSDVFDLRSPHLGAAGTAFEVCHEHKLLDPRVNGHVARDFPNTLCYRDSETESIGVLVWIPETIPNLDDNIIQTDRCEYSIGFNAVQCRHNVANNGGPISRGHRGAFDLPLKLLTYLMVPEIKGQQNPVFGTTLKFNTQLEDGFQDLPLADVVDLPSFLMEPVTKSRDPATPPSESPNYLPLTVYWWGFDQPGIDAPSTRTVKVKDQFTEDPFRLEVFAPIAYADPVTDKMGEVEGFLNDSFLNEGGNNGQVPGDDVPKFPTPLVVYPAVATDNPEPRPIAVTDQFAPTPHVSLGRILALVEPAIKFEGGGLGFPPEKTGNLDAVRPMILYEITSSHPVVDGSDLDLEDQFVVGGTITTEILLPKLYAEPVKKKKLPDGEVRSEPPESELSDISTPPGPDDPRLGA